MHKLEEKLRQQVLIFDGAVGTEIYKRNFFVNTSYEGLCLSAPDVIRDIHRQYFEAGAEVITTNSFGANRNLLARFGLGDQVRAINMAAVNLARAAGDDQTLIAGSIGPVGEVPHTDDLNEEQIIEILGEQIDALADAGVDFILFETLPFRIDVARVYHAINAHSTLPYILSLKVDRNGESPKGEFFTTLLQPLQAPGRKPSALGLNCGDGAESLLSALEKLRPLVSYPLIVQPNAGLPKTVDGRMLYMTSPEYFTTYARRYVQLGARGVGGCCGTGPEHIQDLARSIRPLAVSEYSPKIFVQVEEARLQPETPRSEKSDFGAKLTRGEWVTSVEIVPPRGYDLQATIEKAHQCKIAGIDAINIPDGPRASSRISPIITAQQILEKARIEPILHFCCRDKNLIGIQADLLGCAAIGIQNILFITGDPPKLGDYPFASAVFDVDSIGAVQIQKRLNGAVDLGGKAIQPATRTLIGVGADPNALDLKRELRRTFEKAAAGAEFIITQPVFDVCPLLSFLDKIQSLNIPVIAGIWPLVSYRNAEFMKNEVPGVIVPDTVMQRMAGAKTKEAQREIGIQIARESIAQIRTRVAGVQVSAPFGLVATAIAVISDTGGQ
ncbi:bifunctional homocysteine S-methyltransferase/methylenetetrahydrofolate reductase [candidate division KSB1 bacterium]|nr:bifunctional homocysteine S-methyltransferase/methylenetetrahydrofolate reductase [candidate division KSB1 bacterium]